MKGSGYLMQYPVFDPYSGIAYDSVRGEMFVTDPSAKTVTEINDATRLFVIRDIFCCDTQKIHHFTYNYLFYVFNPNYTGRSC